MNKLFKTGSLQHKFLLAITLIVFPILGGIFTWVEFQLIDQTREQVLDKARILARQVILTRQWVTDSGGGVWLPEESQGAKDVTCFHDERLETDVGTLRRFNPAMVTKKLSDYSTKERLYGFSVSSLNPKNPANEPDDFEKDALGRFMGGQISEIYRFTDEALHYVIPLNMEQGCLKCHAQSSVAHSDVVGGLTIQIPFRLQRAELMRSGWMLLGAGLAITFMTVCTLFFLMRRMILHPLFTIEEQTKSLCRGHLDARVSIDTGDELEQMAESFNEMAQRLQEGRSLLESRIEKATMELATANEDLKKLDRLKSDFLTNMSHELRSPITAIRGGVDYLSRTLEKADNRTYIDIIEKNVTRLSRLVSDMFDFTKLEAGKIEWEFEKSNLTHLVHEVIEITSFHAKKRSIGVICDAPGDLFVEIDFERIEQVIVNILENAIKYADPNTLISVKMFEENGWVTVSVTDEGPGIAPENLKTIFEKFSTVPSGRNSRIEGTGLGLAISRAIVEAHRGKIWAESEEGCYTTLYFMLPVSRQWAVAPLSSGIIDHHNGGES